MVDFRTLFLVLTIIHVSLSAVMAIFWRTQKVYPGFGFWTLSIAVSALGYILFGLRNVIPDFLSIIIGNMALVLGVLLYKVGLHRFTGGQSVFISDLGVMGGTTLLMIVFTYIQPDIVVRAIIISAAIGFYMLSTAWMAFRRMPPKDNFLFKMLGIMMIVYALLTNFRSLAWWIWPENAGLLNQTVINTVHFLMAFPLNVGVTFLFLLFQNQRLSNELTVANTRLERKVIEDGLTGLYNRQHFGVRLGEEIKRALRIGDDLSLLMIDVDLFKSYNDLYGHLAGDRCLIEISEVLTNTFRRAGDLVARYGGEEFAVILAGASLDEAKRMAEVLREKLTSRRIPHEQYSVAGYVSVSVGISHARVLDERYTDEWFINMADRALYQSKQNGRDRISVCEECEKEVIAREAG